MTSMEHIVVKTGLRSAETERSYWLSRPVEARIAALEALRQEYLRLHPDVDARLQRVCRITQLKPG